MIEKLLEDEKYGFMPDADKAFVAGCTRALEKMGYTCGGEIVDGICWGKYMLIFRKASLKKGKVAARIYIRDGSVTFRLFASDVTKHASFIASAPDYIREVFTGDFAACRHCNGEECRFQKRYEIGGVEYIKCNGQTFEFANADLSKLDGYMALFREFYPEKRARAGA